MIQRIQTLYLALIAALMLCMFFMPFALLNGADFSYQFLLWGVSTVSIPHEYIINTWPILAVMVVLMLLPVVNVFLYKRRPLQMKMCAFIAVLLIAFYLLFFGYIFILKDSLHVTGTQLQAALVIPLLALILDYMAFKKIAQDEVLVRSIDRIR